MVTWGLSMEQVERDYLKGVLQELIQGITQTANRRDEIAVENAPDTIDQVQRAGERELAIRQIESDFNKLQNVRLALERFEEGTYGTCLSCEREINIKRLKAVPWASHCVACQEAAERASMEPEEEAYPPLRLKETA